MSQKSSDPLERLGVYKQFEEIPAEERLEYHAAQYVDADPWGDFLINVYLPKHNTYQSQQQARLAGRRWRGLMEERGRHHALARPADVEEWCARLIDEVQLSTVYKSYWSKIEQFYRWLLWHPEHPHCYNPLLLAAANYDVSQTVWNEKMESVGL